MAVYPQNRACMLAIDSTCQGDTTMAVVYFILLLDELFFNMAACFPHQAFSEKPNKPISFYVRLLFSYYIVF